MGLSPSVLLRTDQLLQPEIDAAFWELVEVYSGAGLTGSVVDEWIDHTTSIINPFADLNAELASLSYMTDRSAAGIVSRYSPVLAPKIDAAVLGTSLRWSVKDLIRLGIVAAPDLIVIGRKVYGVAQRYAANQARDTTLENIDRDRTATGWARVSRPGCCAFCAVLSTRGAVYKSEDSARITREGSRYHDNCHCTVDPQFEGQTYEAPEHIDELSRFYRENSDGVGSEKLTNFRRAYDLQYKVTQDPES